MEIKQRSRIEKVVVELGLKKQGQEKILEHLLIEHIAEGGEGVTCTYLGKSVQ